MENTKLGSNRIIRGAGAIEELSQLAGTRRRAYIVMSGTIQEDNGHLELLLDALSSAGFTWKTNTRVEPEPSFGMVQLGAAEMKEYEPDWIIGFGGGSAMDAAKAMRVFYENEHYNNIADVAAPRNIDILGQKSQVCCIPTTAGTGSEVTRAAVITDSSSQRKFPVRCLRGRMVPELAVLDPAFTMTMPRTLTANSGMDAVTHAIEAYVSRPANPFSDVLAAGAFELASSTLPRVLASESDLELRADMLSASCMAGISFSNSGVGLAHSIGHALGARYHIPHGLAVGVALSHVVSFNASFSPETAGRYDYLARRLGEHDLHDAVGRLAERIGLPETLRSVIPEDVDIKTHLDDLAMLALEDVCTRSNPVIPNANEMRRLIIRVTQ